jgi:hypothetical protein
MEQKASAAEQYIQSVLSHFAEEKKNDHEKDA